jgi:hypothetical protein
MLSGDSAPVDTGPEKLPDVPVIAPDDSTLAAESASATVASPWLTRSSVAVVLSSE